MHVQGTMHVMHASPGRPAPAIALTEKIVSSDNSYLEHYKRRCPVYTAVAGMERLSSRIFLDEEPNLPQHSLGCWALSHVKHRCFGNAGKENRELVYVKSRTSRARASQLRSPKKLGFGGPVPLRRCSAFASFCCSGGGARERNEQDLERDMRASGGGTIRCFSFVCASSKSWDEDSETKLQISRAYEISVDSCM